MANTKAKNLRLMDENFGGMKEPMKRKRKQVQGNVPTKSFDEMGIPSDRVAPGAPNPPPQMLSPSRDPAPMRLIKRKKSTMRHGQY